MKDCVRGVWLAVAALTWAAGCARQQEAPDCSGEWQYYVDDTVATGDGMGHGPDIGSDEWKSVVEFKLGVRGRSDVPDRDSAAWCAYIQQQLDQRTGAGHG